MMCKANESGTFPFTDTFHFKPESRVGRDACDSDFTQTDGHALLSQGMKLFKFQRVTYSVHISITQGTRLRCCYQRLRRWCTIILTFVLPGTSIAGAGISYDGNVVL